MGVHLDSLEDMPIILVIHKNSQKKIDDRNNVDEHGVMLPELF